MLSWRPTYRSRSSLTVSTRRMCLAHLAGTGPAAPWWLALREEVDDGDEARGGPQSAPGDAGLPRAEHPVRYCIINKVDRTGRPSATSTSAPSMRAGVRSARCGSIPTGAS